MDNSDWHYQLSHRLRNRQDIPPAFKLTGSEENYFQAGSTTQIQPFLVTPYYFSLADPLDPGCPIRRQVVPVDKEFVHTPHETADPLCEARYTVMPGLVRKYQDRCILKLTDICAVHCRFCFRRFFTGVKNAPLTPPQVKDAARYIAKHMKIRELLLTGGDPFTMEDDRLDEYLQVIRRLNPYLVVRIGTRTPAVMPQRITPALVSLLSGYKPLWVVTHYNHSKELTDRSRQALGLLVDAGIPVVNQTVLLKDVNDKADALADLFSRLVSSRVKPYYLFQGDLAEGTAHFRTDIGRGLSLMKELKRKVSGLCLPLYAVDLPQGGGKVLLQEATVKSSEKGFYIIENYAKKQYKYPEENN
ncbi:MAG: KamA family radical SAM protein [Spirochaetales bacterium]|nr:KamA family radical SAM protein [Spirochaetales bacterium]